MGPGAESAGIAILRRILAYGRKVLRWEDRLDAVRDFRRRPQIATRIILRAAVVLFLGRLGSLNALEQTRPSSFWRRWLGRLLPSADTIGRVCALMDVQTVREVTRQVYSRLKRNKVLEDLVPGLSMGVLDGHESHATYYRHCGGCLERTIHTDSGDETQNYHRHVGFQLVAKGFSFMLDAEPMLPGEDAVATALRLLDRVVKDYPRAFNVIAGDAKYVDPRLFRWALDHDRHALTVLKDDRRDLVQDAIRLFADQAPTCVREGTPGARAGPRESLRSV